MIGRAIRRYSCKVLVFWLRDNIVCIIGFDMAIFKKKDLTWRMATDSSFSSCISCCAMAFFFLVLDATEVTLQKPPGDVSNLGISVCCSCCRAAHWAS